LIEFEQFTHTIVLDGNICLDIIADKWSPVYTVGSILTSIQSLLTDPNTDSPANPEAAQLYQNDRKAYNRKVRICSEESINSAIMM
jgi:ubiquitin-protein ligase